MTMILSLFFWVLMGASTAYMANQRGRDPYAWFAIGIFLGLLGLLLLMLLPALNGPGSVNSKSGDAADKTLTLEPEVVPAEAHDPVLDYPVKDWFCINTDHLQQGPLRFNALRELFDDKKIDLTSFVWCEGMPEWKRISDLPVLVAVMQQSAEQPSPEQQSTEQHPA